MTKPSHYRRRPVISTIIFIAVLLIGLLAFALFQLDIGSYQQQFVEKLQKAIKKPVSLGDAKLSLHGGIALDFHNLQIGDDDNFKLLVPELSTILNLRELLYGNIVIEQVILESPNLTVSLPLTLAESTLDLDKLGLKTLQIRKGNLTVFDTKNLEVPLQIDDFNLVIHGLGKGRVTQIVANATLFQKNRNAQLNLFLELNRENQEQSWRQGSLDGEVSLNDLKSNLLANRISSELPGQFDFQIKLQGIPADKVLFSAAVLDSHSNAPLFSLTSDWQSSPGDDSFRNMKLGLDGIPLTGQLSLNRMGDEPQLTGSLELSQTEIQTLLARIKPLAKLTGQVEKLEMSFLGPLHATNENPLSPLQSAYVSIKNLAYPFANTSLTDTEMRIELQNARLSLKEGRGIFAQNPFHFTAASGTLNQNEPELIFALNSVLDLKKLQTEFASPFLSRQKLEGSAPLDLVIKGPMGRLTTHLKIDLSKTALEIGKLLDKNLETPSSIEFEGSLEPDHIAIKKAQLNIAQASVQITGDLTNRQDSWSGDLQIEPLSLAALQPVSPIFSFFRISGETQGQLNLGGETGWNGQFNVKDGGTHLTQIIGDLSQVDGVLNLNKEGFDLEEVHALLGQSPINVTGGLRNWKSPLLSLHVTAKKLRAQDLIFTNPEMMLHNLNGQLLIGAGGITFDQISVSLDDGTTAQVDGLMRSYRSPQTYLEINSDKADILNIIQLFIGPKRSTPKSKTNNNASLEIQAKVKQGRLGSFFFENATATITDRNDVFTVFPLDFKLGAGTATGRVEIDKLRNNLLKISGQAHNCDADSVYEMLFEKKGIFQGTLSGDFYLEGEEIGEQFWKTSQGGGHLEIKDGVMRELKGFAQIFSLLNVSQLFKFRLPDMNTEGLPLSELKTSARITDGIVYFDDFRIVSPAINISAVGKLNTLNQTIDSTLGIKPLRTVDIILSRVPLFGWVLTGDEEALVTALFTLRGPLADPKVGAAPVSSVANTALGIIGRTLGLPFRMLQKTGEFLSTPARPDEKKLIPQEESSP